MKNYLILAVIFLFAVQAKTQNVFIPDPIFKQVLLSNTSINTNNDNEIQFSEALAHTDGIACSDLNITDLTGIEAFTQITELSCHNNLLTSLDLSANIKLVGIECSNNLLTQLIFPVNNAMEFLYCSNNQLNKLDVSNMTSLIELTCRFNQIDSLDLSSSPSFAALIANDNSLRHLNVANGNNTNIFYFETRDNSQLDCIHVDLANYSTENWKLIDTNTHFFDEQTDCGIVGLRPTLFDQKIKISPNPTTDFVSIEAPSKEFIQSISVQNIYGRMLLHLNDNSSIDFRDFMPGMYFIRFELKNGKTEVHQVIKE